ncbi:Decaprenyl diphosphate synthase-like protein [Chlamydoabsidia padenii]|nr:Decaprenyl diphosphate synthase-like protein [Chlamydoabsidia padenii]
MTLVTTTTTQQECHHRRSSLQIVASDPILPSPQNYANTNPDPIKPASKLSMDTDNKAVISNNYTIITRPIINALCVSILYLIHFVYIAHLAQQVVRTTLHRHWRQFVWNQQDNKQPQDAYSLLKKDQGQLTKVPHHLAITVSSEHLLERSEEDWKTVISDLCQVTCWAWEMGIKEISVFDATGVLKNKTMEINKEQSMALHCWKKEHHPEDDLTQNDFRFIILSLEDSQSQLVKATQKSYQHYIKNNNASIDIDLVNGFMQESMSDPDLMIIYDGLPHNYVSIDGYSPWHIRLTEFVNATSHHRLDYPLYISCLYKYSKVEQRFGQ